jgi:hypothetical protein
LQENSGSDKKTPSSRHRFPSDTIGLPKAMRVASAEQNLRRQKKRSLLMVNASAEQCRSKHFSDKCNSLSRFYIGKEIGVFLHTLIIDVQSINKFTFKLLSSINENLLVL